ncbi:MAG: hypothetical protein R3C19_21245 [Planctomycetaceae bacterium]
MRTFARRRGIHLGITLVAAILLLGLYYVMSASLYPGDYSSGWVLLGVIVFLAAYNVRKAFPFIPLGSSAAWLQAHIYLGLLTFLLFAIHVEFTIPNGFFERILAGVYVSVFVSGLIGLYMTRRYPRRLTMLGSEVVFEHIPVLNRQIREAAEALVLQCNSEAETSAIPDFYVRRLRSFMDGHQDLWQHLFFGSSRRFHALLRELYDQMRYLNDNERSVLSQLENLLRRKHELDSQFALQAALKCWLFAHIPLTWALLVFAFFHSMLVHAWSGGLW